MVTVAGIGQGQSQETGSPSVVSHEGQTQVLGTFSAALPGTLAGS